MLDTSRKNVRLKGRRSFSPATAAQYDSSRNRVTVVLQSGLELSFAPDDVQELKQATGEDLRKIEITPSGLGLYFPKADGDIYLPALMEGFLGSRRWMASRLGLKGGRARTEAKVAASRANGKLGGRPKKKTG